MVKAERLHRSECSLALTRGTGRVPAAHLVDPGVHLCLAGDSEQHAEDEAQEHQRKEQPACIVRL